MLKNYPMTWQNTVGDSLNLLVPAELKAIELILPYLLVTKVWSYLWGPAGQKKLSSMAGALEHWIIGS